jgi:hypothetical protein
MALTMTWQVRDMTYNDVSDAVQQAISDSIQSSTSWLSSDDGDDENYVYVIDMTDTWVVYEIGWDGCFMQCDYSIDADGVVTLGDAVEVQRETTYAPAGDTSADVDRSTRLPSQVRKGNPLSKTETRAFNLSNVQMRMDDDGFTAHFTGYASTTDQAYGVRDYMGEYDETIKRGAFKKTLREADVPLLFNHDGMPIASTGGGTMRLSEDDQGLKVEADLDRRQSLTNDICIAMERGDLRQMSFSFQAVQQSWNTDYTQRDVTELRLFDASIVTYPANPNTSASLRGGSARQAEAYALSTISTEERQVLVDHAVGSAHARLAEKIIELDEFRVDQERAGKAISAANTEVLQNALAAAHACDDLLSTDVSVALSKVDDALDLCQQALSDVLGVDDPDGDASDTDDKSADTSKGSNDAGTGSPSASSGQQGNPISPADGAGARKVTPTSVITTRAMIKQLQQL